MTNPPPTSPVPAVPEDLKDAIIKGRCAAFIGAGLSVSAGYPKWESLITILITKAANKGYIDPKKKSELESMTKTASKWLMVAQELTDSYGQAIFHTELVTLFESIGATPTAAHILITEIPFQFVVTTNYDQLIENAYFPKFNRIPKIFTHADVSDFADSLWKQDFFILKAHGDLQKKSSIILTEKDYRTVIYSSNGYRSLLAAIFTTKTILFLGVSLSDPELHLLLTSLHDAFHGSGPYHYALVSKDEFNDTEAALWRKNFNIQCMIYEPSKGHPEVETFLKNLKDEITAVP
ncbi:MAG TPA: SIR2 family protein [Pyrinomonadaceae bacterium]|jgi:hypothetical protein|nr:SIR2 family protein [Pyrinomonadaceae bacterium]